MLSRSKYNCMYYKEPFGETDMFMKLKEFASSHGNKMRTYVDAASAIARVQRRTRA